MSSSNDQHGWHVDKTVSVSHLLTTVSIVVAGLWFVSQQNERIALNEQAIRQNTAQIASQETRVDKSLNAINAKLDRLQDLIIERYQSRKNQE